MVNAVGRAPVILFGDSHLAPSSSNDIRKLDSRLRDAGWEVQNLAVAGLSTRSALELVSEFPAGPAVLSFGGNDAAPWKRVPLSAFARNYERILGMCSGKIIVLGPTPVAFPSAWPRTNRQQRRYAAEAGRVTRDVGGAFVDLFQLLAGRDGMLLRDGVHLTDAAYELIAVSVLDELSESGVGA